MNVKEARRTLDIALNNQKTISITKLNKLLDALEIDLEYQDSKVREVKFLKGEIKKLAKHNKALLKGINRLKERTCDCER